MLNRILLPASLMVVLAASLPARAENSPAINATISQLLSAELLQHHSRDTAWFDEKFERKQKRGWTKLFNKEVVFYSARWTEESKSWVWLDEPHAPDDIKHFHLEVTHFDFVDGRIQFAAHAHSKAKFVVWGRFSDLARGDVSGSAIADISISGSVRLENNHLHDAQIDHLDVHLDHVKFNEIPLKPLEKCADNIFNCVIDHKNEKFRRQIEKAMNKVEF